MNYSLSNTSLQYFPCIRRGVQIYNGKYTIEENVLSSENLKFF